MNGVLYIVATPIGNLEDITMRAARVLGEVQAIACEDTRQTQKLLSHLGVSARSLSYHEHNEAQRTPELIEMLQRGESIALVSDAGTPLVSDPGYRLVQAAIAAGIRIVPIPGASAILGGLAAAGLPTDAFRFGGFLPPKTSQRRKTLEALKGDPATLVFYEAPHRIVGTLEDVEAVLGDRDAVVAREITKLHEEFLRGRVSEIRAELERRGSVKGEITLLIGKGAVSPEATDVPLEDAVAALVAQGVERMDAIKQVARDRGLSKRDVYKQLTTDGRRER